MMLAFAKMLGAPVRPWSDLRGCGADERGRIKAERRQTQTQRRDSRARHQCAAAAHARLGRLCHLTVVVRGLIDRMIKHLASPRTSSKSVPRMP